MSCIFWFMCTELSICANWGNYDLTVWPSHFTMSMSHPFTTLIWPAQRPVNFALGLWQALWWCPFHWIPWVSFFPDLPPHLHCQICPAKALLWDFYFRVQIFFSFSRNKVSTKCQGITRQPSMAILNSWKRQQHKIWTPRTRMEWHRHYGLPTMGSWRLYSWFAVDGEWSPIVHVMIHHIGQIFGYNWCIVSCYFYAPIRSCGLLQTVLLQKAPQRIHKE